MPVLIADHVFRLTCNSKDNILQGKLTTAATQYTSKMAATATVGETT